MNRLARIAAIALLSLPLSDLAASQPLNLVAAENFYGDVARQLGGPFVHVTSIMNNPEQDPHLFEASVSTAKALSGARIVVYNGIDYDPWMNKLLSATPSAHRKTIVAGQLMHKKSGDNPHLWYNPATMPVVARAITAELEAADPVHGSEYRQNLKQFLSSLAPLDGQITALRARYAGTPVTATEPIFGYMADALGFTMRNAGFQLAVMNNTEPSASQIAAFESDLKTRKVKVLFYNIQASDPSAKRVRQIALSSKIPVVGITETEPAGKRYQEWMTDQLDILTHALAGGSK